MVQKSKVATGYCYTYVPYIVFSIIIIMISSSSSSSSSSTIFLHILDFEWEHL